MRELLRDVETMQQILHQRLLRGAIAAAGRLDRAARGKYRFGNEWEFKSAVALARFTPRIIGEKEEYLKGSIDDPEFWTPEKLDLLEILDDEFGPEDWAASWSVCFKTFGPNERYSTKEEAREYGRQRWEIRRAEREAKREEEERAAFDRKLNE